MTIRLAAADLNYLLQQANIRNDYSQLTSAIDPNGVREVSGHNNNLVGGYTLNLDGSITWNGNVDPATGQWVNTTNINPDWGQADTDFLRILGTDHPGLPSYGTTYDQVNQTGTQPPVTDADPRLITNLIASSVVDPNSPVYNPAAVAAMENMGGHAEVIPDGSTTVGGGTQGAYIPNPGILGGIPYNEWFVAFGQFFDHGLDFISKSGGYVLIPLSPSDPLYNDAATGPMANMMMLDRASLSNPDTDFTGGVLNAGVTPTYNNNTGLMIDQSQTYGSHEAVNALLRQYDANGNLTGRLIDGNEDGLVGGVAVGTEVTDGFGNTRVVDGSHDLATWADMVVNAARIGVLLLDTDVLDAPAIRADAVGGLLFDPVPGLNYSSDLSIDDIIARDGSYNAAADPFFRDDAGNVLFTNQAILADMGFTANPAMPGYDAAALAAHYVSGDGRVNENIGLTAVHHVFHEEHNIQVGNIHNAVVLEAANVLASQGAVAAADYINQWTSASGTTSAGGTVSFDYTDGAGNAQTLTLDGVNITAGDAIAWDGERVYQAARLITESEYNHIAVDQYLGTLYPALPEFVSYSSDINLSVSLEFSQAVFRLGHSMLRETLQIAVQDANGVLPGEPDYVPTYATDTVNVPLTPPEFSAPRLNEIHYDNTGVDSGEFIEVRVAAGTDVSDLRVELYNGGATAGITGPGNVYRYALVSDGTMTSDGSYDYYVLPAGGTGANTDPNVFRNPNSGVVTETAIQNGSPDGFALVRDNGTNDYLNGDGVADEVIEFLSYEGNIVHAYEGAAAGMDSVDIISTEQPNTPVGYSIQRLNDGNWTGPTTATEGAATGLSAPDPTVERDSVDLFEAFLNPALYDQYGPAGITLGLMNQQGNEVDEFVTPALQQSLLGIPLDLGALNIARGRDVGLPTLNEFRQQVYDGLTQNTNNNSNASGLAPYKSWTDFLGHLRNPESGVNFLAAYGDTDDVYGLASLRTNYQEGRDAAGLASTDVGFAGAVTLQDIRAAAQNILDLYAAGDMAATTFMEGDTVFNTTTNQVELQGLDMGFWNIDLWIGGLAEQPLFDGPLGTTFSFIMLDFAQRMQDGDRFYYLYRMPVGHHLGDQIIGEQFADLIMRTTGLEHINGDAFGTASATFILDGDTVKTDVDMDDDVNDYFNAIQETLPDGTSANDGHIVVAGLEGNDTIIGALGDDTIYGDDGDDIIEGAQGNDHLYGGDGDDWITDYENDDFISGGRGNDHLFGGPGVLDTLHGNEGDDEVHGGDGIDEVFGDDGNDRLYGEGDTDLMEGGDGHDYMDGGDSVDEMFAGNGNDWMRGGVGDDHMNGGSGNDLMEGGLGPTANDGDRYFGDSPPGVLPVIEFNGDGTQGEMDIASYEEVGFNIVASLQTSNNAGTSSNLLDQYGSVEGLVGGRFDDRLEGGQADAVALNGANNYLVGGAGNDTLIGLGDDRDEANGNIDFLFGDSIIVDNSLFWVGDARNTSGTYTVPTETWYDTGEIRPEFAQGWLGHILGDNGDAGDHDVAVYFGTQAGYDISQFVVTDANGVNYDVVRIEDIDLTDGDDGIDYLVDVEYARFGGLAGADVSLMNAAPTDIVWNALPPSGLPDTGETLATLTVVDPDSTAWTYAVTPVGTDPQVLDVAADGTVTVAAGLADGEQATNTITATDDFGNAYAEDFHLQVADSNGTTITGTGITDIIYARGGHDTVNAGAGDDVVYGQNGDDILNGEGGDDTFHWNVGNGRDVIDGGTEGALGDTFVANGNGSYEVFDIYGPNALPASYTGSAEIIVVRTQGANVDIIAELTSIEEIVIHSGGGGGAVNVHGDFTNVINPDTITIDATDGHLVVDVSQMTSNEHVVLNTGGTYEVVGKPGQQVTVNGIVTNGTASAGETPPPESDATPPASDAPTIVAGDVETFVGGSDGEVVVGTDATRVIYTDGGDDVVMTGNAATVVMAGDGDDVVNGGAGDDIILGGDGDDVIDSGGGNDKVWGDDGADLIYTGDGDDLAFGGDGADEIHGGAGADRIEGGGGADLLIGDDGSDRFVFRSESDADGDTIADFQVGDVIDVSSIDANGALDGDASFSILTANAFTAEGQLIVHFDAARNATLVEGNTDGDVTTAEFQITLDGDVVALLQQQGSITS